MSRISWRSTNDFGCSLAWLKNGKTPVVSSIGRRILRRPFPASAQYRILLAYQDDALAYPQFYGFLRYTERFSAHGIHFRAIPFRELDCETLPPDLDALFVQSSYTPISGALESLFEAVRDRRPNLHIAYFDWFAPSDIRLAARVNPWIDAYVKKALLRETSDYLVPIQSHTNLTEYYGARFGLSLPDREWTIPPEVIAKLDVSPAFSTGPKMIGMFENAAPPAKGERDIDLHARIAVKGSSWYSAMRQESKDALAAFPDLQLASEGLIPKSAFLQELSRSKLCFSPFGYGEICWRDFEAIACGAVVVKPDTSHLRTDPDIYRPFETYIPVKWDLSDLESRVREALADPKGTRRIAEKAYAVVHDHLTGPALEALAARLVGCR